VDAAQHGGQQGALGELQGGQAAEVASNLTHVTKITIGRI
jgi:hypothetical protein